MVCPPGRGEKGEHPLRGLVRPWVNEQSMSVSEIRAPGHCQPTQQPVRPAGTHDRAKRMTARERSRLAWQKIANY